MKLQKLKEYIQSIYLENESIDKKILSVYFLFNKKLCIEHLKILSNLNFVYNIQTSTIYNTYENENYSIEATITYDNSNNLIKNKNSLINIHTKKIITSSSYNYNHSSHDFDIIPLLFNIYEYVSLFIKEETVKNATTPSFSNFIIDIKNEQL